MQTATVGAILKDRRTIPKSYYLYAIVDGKTVFYIGQTTRGISERLHVHVYGGYGHGPSRFGRLVNANYPASFSWRVVAFTPREVLKSRCPKPNRMFRVREGPARDWAEKALIAHYRPCLNIADNPHPRPLPGHYKRPATRRHRS